MLHKEELKNSVILIYANKQDIEDCFKINELIERYNLNNIKDNTWHIQPCSGKTGEGLIDGIQWLSQKIISKKDNFQNNPYLLNKKNCKKEVISSYNNVNDNTINSNNIEKIDVSGNNNSSVKDIELNIEIK